jgi:hypothetical protein
MPTHTLMPQREGNIENELKRGSGFSTMAFLELDERDEG